MKTTTSHETDASLHEALRAWPVTAPLPPRFQEGVWRGIERAEEETSVRAWEVFQAWLGNLVPRPAFALAYASLALLAGLAAGYTHAASRSGESEAGWRAGYVQSVDPWQAPHSS